MADTDMVTAAPVARMPGRTALRVLAAVAVGAVLYVARPACVPVALAALFALILAGPVESLHRRLRLPRSLGALLVLAMLGTLIGASANLLWRPAQHWWNAAPATLRTIERKLRPATQFMSRVELLSNRADQLTSITPSVHAIEPRNPDSPSVVVEVGGEGLLAQPGRQPFAVAVLDQTRDALIGIVTVVMLTLFLLAGGPPMLARMSAALASDRQSAHALRVVRAVRSELSRYYVGLALINVGLGSATAGLALLLGMPNPLLWGAVAGVLNFIPYVGSATTLALLTVVAFVTLPGIGQVLLLAGGYLVLATLEGQVVQPLVIGRRLELNPIIVFLALWFGGWFWGVAGIVMAVPSLVALKVVAAHSRHGKPLAEFLSPNADSRLGRLRRLAPAAVAALTPRAD